MKFIDLNKIVICKIQFKLYMKLLSTLISESLEAKYIKYFKQILATNNALVKDNKIQQIDVDINNIGCPDKPFLFNDFCQIVETGKKFYFPKYV